MYRMKGRESLCHDLVTINRGRTVCRIQDSNVITAAYFMISKDSLLNLEEFVSDANKLRCTSHWKI
jgi:hypothetical protein